MPIASGSSSRASSRNSTEIAEGLTAGHLAFLIFLGVMIVVLHETIRYPLRIPGHHGLEGMALLALARMSSKYRWAATVTALSAATTAVGIGAGHGWMTPFLNLAPGIVVDLAVLAFANWRGQIIILPLIAAFAHAIKPLMRLFVAETVGTEFGSFRVGALWPISTHIAFGFAGALIGVLAWRFWEQREKKPE